MLKGLILDCKNDLISDCDHVKIDLEENMDNKSQDVKMIKNSERGYDSECVCYRWK